MPPVPPPPRRSFRHRPRRAATGALLLLALCCGCANYYVGVDSLYAPDVTTVYVPPFESFSYRPHLGEQLTEAVIKEIQSRTSFTVVNSPNADSILTGKLISDSKSVLVENRFDEPRELQVTLAAQVSWVDRKGDLIRETTVALPPEVLDVVGAESLVPEVGQSVATSNRAAIWRIAARIVDMMEIPWGDEAAPQVVFPQ